MKKYPLITTFLISLFVFAVFGELGFWLSDVNVEGGRLWKNNFQALGLEESKSFTAISNSLEALEFSTFITKNSSATLVEDISRLQKLRAKSPNAIEPVLDLQIAMDELYEARLLERSGDVDRAKIVRSSAKTHLNSLGWADVPESDLNEIADTWIDHRLLRFQGNK